MEQPRRILVRAPNWTGDLIMATPGFRALRAGFPDAHIALHVLPGLLELVAGAPWFDELLPVASRARGLGGLLREGLALRAHRFDLGVCLPDSFSSALLMRAAGVRRVVGYRRGWRRALLHDAIPLPREAGRRVMMPREAHVLGLVDALGCPPRGRQLELFVTPAERERAGERLEAAGVAPDAPLALLAPGASYGPSKLWPAASFAAVGDALAAEGAQVVVVGTPAERSLVRSVVEAMRAPAADLAGELGLGALKAVVARGRVLVCNDAGARHVAVALGVPCIVLMGPTALEKTGWNLERVSVFTAEVDCRPCYQRVCPIDHRCMTRIPAERVAAEARQAWRSAAGAWLGQQHQLPACGPAA